MAQFVGSWNLEQAKNVEALFHKIGVTQIKKEHLDNPKGVVTFTLDGNKMTMKMDSPVRKSEVTFTFGVEFEEETFSGQKARNSWLNQRKPDLHSNGSHAIPSRNDAKLKILHDVIPIHFALSDYKRIYLSD
ncbi:hypothetical protein FBUS_04104 [Fasciolopsis buskii]|uniref:Uncharacterized protein n=1 Tax=Fasciolopsis buskii TaxID=27845 RepID=A0A8E0S4M3_9TREM|nr:hypothetical protein FBUS_04104 [Fasciolopsis buski]